MSALNPSRPASGQCKTQTLPRRVWGLFVFNCVKRCQALKLACISTRYIAKNQVWKVSSRNWLSVNAAQQAVTLSDPKDQQGLPRCSCKIPGSARGAQELLSFCTNTQIEMGTCAFKVSALNQWCRAAIISSYSADMKPGDTDPNQQSWLVVWELLACSSKTQLKEFYSV